MSLLIHGVILQIAVSLIILIWYLNRSGRVLDVQPQPDEDSQPRPELKRAELVVHELEALTNRLRDDLSTHCASILRFKNAVAQTADGADDESCVPLREEAEQLLKPTAQLAEQLAHASDEIRQHTTHLMTLAEVRKDSLTGLNNRQAFEESGNLMLSLMSRYGRVFTVIKTDIDSFQRTNDKLGSLYGDHLLQQLSTLIDRSARENDVVCRYDGDEFAIVLPETELEAAAIFAERLRRYIDEQLPIQVSFGLTRGVESDDDVSDVLARCNSALAAAKKEGGNTVFEHCGQETRRVTTIDEHSPKPTDRVDESSPGTAKAESVYSDASAR